MKTVALIFLVMCCFTIKAQISSTQIKSELAGKEWKIAKYETFGVEEEPKDEQIHDQFALNSDMTFFIVENGKEYLGNWVIQPDGKVGCKSKTGEWSKSYKVISINDKTATIEYQDSDLTRTLYRLELK